MKYQLEDIEDYIDDIFNTYYCFRFAQSEFLNRPYRLPKDFKSFLFNRMKAPSRECLIDITKCFFTKWERIDKKDYFRCGFKIMGKGFTYHRFFDKRIIEQYIQIDRAIKRDMTHNKGKFVESVKFVKKFLKENKLTLLEYCNKKIDGYFLPVRHYIENDIDKIFLAWLIKKGYYVLSDYDRSILPYVVDNYREMYVKLEKMNSFIRKIGLEE